MFLFFHFANSAGNIARFGSSLSFRTNYINIKSVNPSGNYIFLIANNTFQQNVMKNQDISTFSCQNLTVYKHITFQTQLLIDGKGRFQFPALRNFDLYLLDCDKNVFESVPQVNYHIERPLIWITILIFIEFAIIIVGRHKFTTKIDQIHRERYTVFKYFTWLSLFLLIEDAFFCLISLVQINAPNEEISLYFSIFKYIHIAFIVEFSHLFISGFPVIDTKPKWRLLWPSLIILSIIAEQHTKFNYIVFAFIPILIFTFFMESRNHLVDVNNFKQHLKTIEPAVFAKIQKFHLDVLPFLYYKKYVNIGMISFTITVLSVFCNSIFGLGSVLEISGYVLSIYLIIHKSVPYMIQLEGIVLEKLVPSMLAD